MFQLCYGDNTTVINISSVLITYDKELFKYNFVFFVSIRPTPIAFSKHEAGAHQYPYLYG